MDNQDFNTGEPAMEFVPSAPSLENHCAEDDEAPPSYAEATGLPPTSSAFSSVPPWAEPTAADSAPVPSWQPSGDSSPATAQSGVTPAAEPQTVVQAGTADGDAPPSYDSIFGRVKEAKEESSGLVSFLMILFAPLGCVLALVAVLALAGVVLGMPVTLLGVGAYFYHDCPLQPGLPTWMVVGGLAQLLHTLYLGRGKSSTSVNLLAMLFYLAWYIAGAVFIYPMAWPHYEPEEEGDLYCGYVVYVTSFVVINVWSVMMVLMCCVVAL